MIGNKIKERRLALKLSQNQLEIMTGIKKTLSVIMKIIYRRLARII